MPETVNNPASLYNAGDIVNVEYQVIASDDNNILWLKKWRDDESVYIAEVSCDDFFELDFWDKAFLSNAALKELSEIKIVKQIEKTDYGEGDNSGIEIIVTDKPMGN